ncbi:MAG: hypothetical protein Rpha_0328 [Candidatus Ruthia sp. Apha_13_S6]|nr:hypothetical protein [Candidatus Ruthia sp. Apha_13_S6]
MQVVTAVISTVWQVGSAIFNTVGTMANSIDGAIGATGKILTAITQGAQIGFVGGITGGSLESANKGASTGLAQSIGHNWLGTGEGLTGTQYSYDMTRSWVDTIQDGELEKQEDSLIKESVGGKLDWKYDFELEVIKDAR